MCAQGCSVAKSPILRAAVNLNPEKLNELHVRAEAKRRPRGVLWAIFAGVTVITGAAIFLARSPSGDQDRRVQKGPGKPATGAPTPGSGAAGAASSNAPSAKPGDVILTVSGYIVNRERIELSPRFLGVVKWIGVKKGDPVTNNQVVVLLDDLEYKARLKETKGRLAGAKAAVEKAELDFSRIQKLSRDKVESKEAEDDARIRLDSARASLTEVEGQVELAQTYLDWTVIRSPINGVVLEKLVDPDELVVPQSFGGARGPSTALISVADPKDLQVEIELNESFVAKTFLGQKCRISPEAYPERRYDGDVVEMAPEANRQKGTLQIKVQIRNPDRFLTPELSAQVDFLSGETPAAKQ
jgi:HlyD family secretion protein